MLSHPCIRIWICKADMLNRPPVPATHVVRGVAAHDWRTSRNGCGEYPTSQNRDMGHPLTDRSDMATRRDMGHSLWWLRLRCGPLAG